MIFEKFTVGMRKETEILYRMYGKTIRAIAYQYLKDEDLAEDCLQETFTALWNALQSGEDIRNPGGWLLRVCRNVSLSVLRRSRRVTVLEDPSEPLPDIDTAAMPEEAVYIAQILACLPAQEREVFTLHVMAGLRLTEIARMMEALAATVRWRYATARRLLQAQLQKESEIV